MATISTLFIKIKMGNQQLVLNTIITKVTNMTMKASITIMMEINMSTKVNTTTMIMMDLFSEKKTLKVKQNQDMSFVMEIISTLFIKIKMENQF